MWEDVINRICEICFITDENNDYALQNVLNFSPEAGTYFTNWRNGLIHKVNQIKDDGLVDSRIMKIPMIAARLALMESIEPQKKELLDNVPALFSTAEAIQAGKEVGLSERSVMYMLVNLTTSKVIRKIKRGEYEKLQ